LSRPVPTDSAAWTRLSREIEHCERCPRLREHCTEVAQTKRRQYQDEEYWGRPIAGFGDPQASILFVGLAPGAHGANRTGRLFTGDRSGEWLYAALHRAKLSNRVDSIGAGDGLQLSNSYITNVCRCAPPQNRPSVDEIESCRPYLDREIELLREMRVVVALGGIAWTAILRRARRSVPESVPTPQPKFGHAAEVTLMLLPQRPLILLGCYHPSQQNTQTGRLTRPMLDAVMRRACKLAGRS
jgi:uracil-DNA glycosylase family 4